jgi:hypothetical protein
MGGCSVTAVLDIPRLRPSDFALGGGDLLRLMPTSRLFDPFAPHTHTMTLTLDIATDNALGVAVEVGPTAAAAPPPASSGGARGDVKMDEDVVDVEEGGAQPAGVVVRDVNGQALVTVEPGENATVGLPSGCLEWGGFSVLYCTVFAG